MTEEIRWTDDGGGRWRLEEESDGSVGLTTPARRYFCISDGGISSESRASLRALVRDANRGGGEGEEETLAARCAIASARTALDAAASLLGVSLQEAVCPEHGAPEPCPGCASTCLPAPTPVDREKLARAIYDARAKARLSERDMASADAALDYFQKHTLPSPSLSPARVTREELAREIMLSTRRVSPEVEDAHIAPRWLGAADRVARLLLGVPLREEEEEGSFGDSSLAPNAINELQQINKRGI